MHPCIKYGYHFEYLGIVSRETLASDTITVAITGKKLAISGL